MRKLLILSTVISALLQGGCAESTSGRATTVKTDRESKDTAIMPAEPTRPMGTPQK